MLLLKKIDVYGQFFAAIACLGSVAFTQEGFTAFSFYFVVGTWQIISVLLHLAFPKNNPVINQRKKYQNVLLATLSLSLFSCIQSFVAMVVLGGLLLVAPFLAIWYFLICQKELKNQEVKNDIRFR